MVGFGLLLDPAIAYERCQAKISKKEKAPKLLLGLTFLAPRPRLEPGIYGLIGLYFHLGVGVGSSTIIQNLLVFYLLT